MRDQLRMKVEAILRSGPSRSGKFVGLVIERDSEYDDEESTDEVTRHFMGFRDTYMQLSFKCRQLVAEESVLSTRVRARTFKKCQEEIESLQTSEAWC